MTKVHCSVPERFANPLFEVFDGGDFVLSSYHDIEEDETQVQLFFAEPERTEDAKRRLADALAVVGVEARIEVSEIPDEDWKLSYRRHFTTERVSPRIVVRPPWEPAPEAKEGEVVVTLDPGLAFGTGKHETTRACLEYIDEIAGGGSFLDMGCGSGILSIAAAKLGFSPVAGFDIDGDAVAASRENATANGADVSFFEYALGGGAVTLDAGVEAAKGVYPDLAAQKAPGEKPTAPFGPADVVVANILGPLLVAFADEIAGFAKSRLVVSGILSDVYPEVLAAFSARGFSEVSRKVRGEWTTGLLARF